MFKLVKSGDTVSLLVEGEERPYCVVGTARGLYLVPKAESLTPVDKSSAFHRLAHDTLVIVRLKDGTERAGTVNRVLGGGAVILGPTIMTTYT